MKPDATEYGLLSLQLAATLPGMTQPLWLDEAFSALMARKSWLEIHRAMIHDAGPPLYYDLLHLWRCFVGESEIALRLLSLLFSLVVTLLLYRFCLRWGEKRTAVGTSLFWILSPLSIHYAQEVRNYTLFAALSLAYVFYLFDFLFHHRRDSFIYSTILLILSLYTHNTAWFLILAGFLAAVGFAWDRRKLLFLIGSYGIALLLYLPWIPTLLAQMKNTEMTIGWVRQVWSPAAIAETFSAYIPGGRTPPYVDLVALPVPIQALNAILFSFLCGLALVHAWKNKEKQAGFIFLFLCVGLLGPYLYSFLRPPIYLAGRTDFFLFPLWCALIGYGLNYLPGKTIRLALPALLLLEMLLLNLFTVLRPDAYSERDVVQYLTRQGRRDEVILCTGLTRPTLEYYLQDRGFEFVSYPPDMARHLAHINENLYIENTDLRKSARESIHEAVSKKNGGGRFWVVGSERPINRPLFAQLQERRDWNANRIQTPSMGLRKLNEPIFLERYEYPDPGKP